MIRLKQKKAEEGKKAAENQAEMNSSIPTEGAATTATMATNNAISDTNISENDASNSSSGGGLKLLGIGGKSTRTNGEGIKTTGKKKTPGEIRIQKDISDLDGGNVAQIHFPNPNDLTSFHVVVTPDTGPWIGARYDFTFSIPALYPHEPPKVVCGTKIYHPNIDLAGAVCLNILREDWKPVLDINAVIYGLIYLFYEPNPDDPLNKEAAELFRADKAQFCKVVRRTMQGYAHAGVNFPKLV